MTLRNLRVTVEIIGNMSNRPERSRFDINKDTVIDLNPSQEVLAVIRTWPHPAVQAGMVIGPGVYGPIKLIATADDTEASTKFFQFDYLKTPMVWEIEYSNRSADSQAVCNQSSLPYVGDRLKNSVNKDRTKSFAMSDSNDA